MAKDWVSETGGLGLNPAPALPSSFLICKIGLMVPTSGDVKKIKQGNGCEKVHNSLRLS